MNRNIEWRVENITVNQSPYETDAINVKLLGHNPYGVYLDPRSISDLCKSIEYKLNYEAPRYSMPYSEFAALKNKKLVEIDHVIHNPPATIVFWTDRTKTVVKAQDEDYDPEKGIAMAYVKKIYDNKGSYYNNIKKWVEPYYEQQEEEFEDFLNNLKGSMAKLVTGLTAMEIPTCRVQMEMYKKLEEEASRKEKNSIEEAYRNLQAFCYGTEELDVGLIEGILKEALDK